MLCCVHVLNYVVFTWKWGGGFEAMRPFCGQVEEGLLLYDFVRTSFIDSPWSDIWIMTKLPLPRQPTVHILNTTILLF